MEAYVYKITLRESQQFYIGFRFANQNTNTSPEEDLWKTYFTSSEYVNDLIQQYGIDAFDAEVIFKDTNKERCFVFEQLSIKENFGNPLLLNKRYFDIDLVTDYPKFFCTGHTEEIKQKIKQIMLSTEVKEKVERIFEEKYGPGITHNSKIPGLRKESYRKGQVTLMEKYGVDHNMKIPGVKTTMIKSRDATMLERYGTINALQVPEIIERQQEKIKNYWLENHGVVNPLQVPEILQKQQETNKTSMMQKYGVENVSQLKAQCPHCGKIASKGNIAYWHNDNCKKKRS